MSVLLTGGAGFIGSHTCVKLLELGEDIIVVDNLCNSNKEVIRRIEMITDQELSFYHKDLRDENAMAKVFETHDITGVIHFAGYKDVGESVANPLKYYDNNVNSTLSLLKVMSLHGVKNIVFSSSATVYGVPYTVPVQEDFPLFAMNPYGMTKIVIENILKDLYQSDHSLNIALLRYFNPIGAHPSGLIGENPNGIPSNLLPYIMQVAVGKQDRVRVFGNDYHTKDGTGVRDYIHVNDLAEGHLAALSKLNQNCGLVTYNLGTGIGYSVLEIIDAVSKTVGNTIPYEVVGRRAGDVAECYASTDKARSELLWSAKMGLDDMCRDAWNWQKMNPTGYKR